MKRPCAAILCAVLFTVPVQAQTPLLTQPLDSGALVRLHLVNGDVTRGRLLVSFTPDSHQMVFCHYPRTPCQSLDERAARSLPVEAIRELEIARGTRARRGALIGSLMGALLGNLSGQLANGLCERDCTNPTILTFSGAISGALWGTLIGSAMPVWRPVP